MAEPIDYQRLRDDIGASITALTNPEAESIFAEAGETYTAAGSIVAATRVIAIRRLLASSAKLTSYTQNASREELGEVFKHLKDLLRLWQDELASAESSAAGSAARFGKTKRLPTRVREYPNA